MNCFSFTFTQIERNNSDFRPCKEDFGFGLMLHCYNIYLRICLRKEVQQYWVYDIKVDI